MLRREAVPAWNSQPRIHLLDLSPRLAHRPAHTHQARLHSHLPDHSQHLSVAMPPNPHLGQMYADLGQRVDGRLDVQADRFPHPDDEAMIGATHIKQERSGACTRRQGI